MIHPMAAFRLPASRRSLRLGSLVALAAMLFAQAALAIAACQIEAKPSRGAALAAAAEATAQLACHEHAPSSDALCLAHCQASDASLDKAQAPIVVPPAAALPSIAFLPFMESGLQRIPERLPPASPPARILFRTLLI
jgi:hypothetical protein